MERNCVKFLVSLSRNNVLKVCYFHWPLMNKDGILILLKKHLRLMKENEVLVFIKISDVEHPSESYNIYEHYQRTLKLYCKKFRWVNYKLFVTFEERK